MSSKNDMIKKMYLDPAGYGSIKTTFEDARKKINLLLLMTLKHFLNNTLIIKNNYQVIILL